MRHGLYDQATCDIIRQADEEVLGIVYGDDMVRTCPECGGFICAICGKHLGGPCPVPILREIMDG